jgi:hypothetical protein
MSGLLNEGWDYLIQQLADDGIPVVSDIRNVQPPCAIIDPPSVVAQSASLVQCDFPVTIVAPPPGNRDAVRVLLAMADKVIQSQPVQSANPSTYTVGTADLPAYQLTVRLQLRRD